MIIEKKNAADLLPAEYNPRKDLKPGDLEYEKLKRSIEQFGYVEPVIWNKATGRVVGGHQRLKVLMDMGITEVDCVVVDMPEDKEKALNIALNKISGEWDKDKLSLLIADHRQEIRQGRQVRPERRLGSSQLRGAWRYVACRSA